MALSREILVANAALAGLTDEQITAICTLSTNDEASVIAKKTGEIYGGLDADILAVSGMAKNGTEKTYDYSKRVIGALKEQAGAVAGLQTQINSLTKEKERLEKALADGGSDAELKKQLSKTKADLESVTKQFTELNTKYNDLSASHQKEIFDMKISGELANAMVGLKFKTGIPESVQKVIIEQAAAKVKAMNPEEIDDGNGGKIIAYKGADGATLRNPNNQLLPFTTKEMFLGELNKMDVLETVRQQTGAGTKQTTTGGGNGNLNFTGAKTRTEAYDIISQSLEQQGMKPGSAEFQNAMNEAWKENNIASLPEK